MIADLVDKLLCRLLPHRDIWKDVGGERKLYLRRWFLKKSDRDRAGEEGDSGGVFIHRICMSDEDPDPHDHPWDFTTLILAGGYSDEQWDVERVPRGECGNRVHDGCGGFCAGDGTTEPYDTRLPAGLEHMKPGKIARRPAEHLHRVRLFHDGAREREAWTLVFTGPKRRTWGFMTQTGWVNWRKYLGL